MTPNQTFEMLYNILLSARSTPAGGGTENAH
jgi:hypothetical protein